MSEQVSPNAVALIDRIVPAGDHAARLTAVLAHFTGVSDRCEAPGPEVITRSDQESVEEGLARNPATRANRGPMTVKEAGVTASAGMR